MPSKLEQDELIHLLSHPYVLRRTRQASEAERGGYGDVIALSHLMHCEALIQYMTKQAWIAHQTTHPVSEKNALIERARTELKEQNPLPDLIDDALIAPLSKEDNIALCRHVNQFKRDPSAIEILSNTMPLGSAPELSARLIQHMNKIVIHLIETSLLSGHPQATYLLLKKYCAFTPSQAPTHDLMFSPQEIQATYTQAEPDPHGLLSWLKSHFHAQEHQALMPKAESAKLSSGALIAMSFFALTAAYGIKQCIDQTMGPS